MKILVTGATGFVGSKLMTELKAKNYDVAGTSRRSLQTMPELINIGDISEQTDWSRVLNGCDVVVHTAGRAHILKDQADDKLAEFRRVNRDATLKLAHDAKAAGVTHFIFISSIGVNGNATSGEPFSEASVPETTSDYAISKLEAELALKEQFADTSMAITVIRPALICGENAPGNIRRLLKLVESGIPLPFKGIKNKRGMVSLENIVSFIIACIENSLAKNEIFVLADKEKPTTEEIIHAFAQGMNKPARVIWFPSSIINVGLKAIGKENLYEQLFGSLDIDATKASRLLNWQAPVTLYETMKKTAAFYARRAK
ncbi:NAD-dependent epimerase/dehydratase family protein [Enterobacteriaceae bacterium H18W14]|uniref:NAD-dependent epimerase/dehydratase family protein n=1 Tax=Dryocola boscaweniae TaxID=2925397 RepID=UPI0022F05AA0|nr:NAD-dependent epimerase/dehydratase family protein [Dryocola boscaweniae]MCT4716404.1 NAD-dependent epimerase/dehydratase family protein [Dryocola boscaweniae]